MFDKGAIKLSAGRGMREILALAYVTKVVTVHLILLTIVLPTFVLINSGTVALDSSEKNNKRFKNIYNNNLLYRHH